MATLVDYLNAIIGISYNDNTMVWLICVMLIIWFIYQFFTFVYVVLGLNK